MGTPLVTIIIPVFNSEKFLKETLESVAVQSHTNWECLLVDDGSTDRSFNIISTFKERDPRFHFLKREREPKGPSVCRNIGIDASEGDYVMFLDSDDLLHPDCLKQRVVLMEKNPQLDFALFQGEAFGLKQFLLSEKKTNYLEAFLTFDFPWQTSSPIWKGRYLRNGERFDETLRNLEDPELHIRILKKEPRFSALFESEPDFFYRQHRVYKKVKSTSLFHFFEGYERFFSKKELFTGFTTRQKKSMINGFYRIVLFLVPPVEEVEYRLFSKILHHLKELKVIGNIKYMFYLKILRTICRFKQKSTVQSMIYLWAFLIRPVTFTEQLILPKFMKTITIGSKS